MGAILKLNKQLGAGGGGLSAKRALLLYAITRDVDISPPVDTYSSKVFGAMMVYTKYSNEFDAIVYCTTCIHHEKIDAGGKRRGLGC